MADVLVLEEKIKRLRKTLSEKRQKDSKVKGSLELRTFQKQLKRLQRRRRALVAWMGRGTKAAVETEATKSAAKPAAEKPAAPADANEAKAG
jgi:predicted  nucleic acid-binding Zn-ribbon protein